MIKNYATKNFFLREEEMIQQVKAFAGKSDNRYPIPETYLVEGENQLLLVFSDLHNVCPHTQMHTHVLFCFFLRQSFSV